MPPVDLSRVPRALLAAALLLATAPAAAQQRPPVTRPPADTTRRAGADTTRRPGADTTRARGDTTRAAADTAARPAGPRRTRAAVEPRPVVRPPISPRRAFLYSFALPGLGQSRLQRSGAGALFVAIEATAFVMARKSLGDLREAKAFRGDSLVPALFPVDSTAAPVIPATTRVPNVFNSALVRARRLHFEDWLAVIAFNHLFAGAEAFVSANLWDLPTEVSARPTDRGTTVAVTVKW